ncbi:hypothetical protein [Nocardiopsis sp. L17-MgMaSL7]|uniref:hypothetical protein n=1 Tax=Nocardiopsis sp. L17-MgMaSL7 TaxID=1938893 RepID=UPI000D710B1A|nr:hypothetical protein [Nocardiopsis sp. L17-MgMaSL7]PWV54557.1 hypothetical protein BDW27_10417 [Nocardiopsis sp. L17-MgMaSL7]
MILSLLATVAVLAALVVIAAALVLAEPTLVYFALGLGGLSVLLLLGALIQGRFGGSSSDTARTDGLGKSSVPVVAAASAAGAVPGTQWEPEHSGRVPAPAAQPVRESAVTEPSVPTGHEVGGPRAVAAEENEEEAEFEVPRWQTPTMGSWPEPVVEPEAEPKPEEHSERPEPVPEPDGSDEPPQVEKTPEREAIHEAALDPTEVTEVEDAPEPVVAVAEREPVTEPDESVIEPERADEWTSVAEIPAEETTVDVAPLPESDDEAHAQEPHQEDRAPEDLGREAPDPAEDVEPSVAYAALLDAHGDDPEEGEPQRESDHAEPHQAESEQAESDQTESEQAASEQVDLVQDPQVEQAESDQEGLQQAASEQVEPEQDPQVERVASEQARTEQDARTEEAETSLEPQESDTAPESARENEDEPVREDPADTSAPETDTPEGPEDREEPQDRVEDSGRTREPDSSLSA